LFRAAKRRTGMSKLAGFARSPLPLDEPFDLLVIGGGIVGSGVARDAAMRGLRVALVDQHDFAFGTSSRSSRLLHGGLRYLEQGHINLVRQASMEKKILARIAPHLAEPLGFIFPSYRGIGRPLWQLQLGVKAYDLLAGRNFFPSIRLASQAVLHSAPGLSHHGLTGAVRYFDALTNDARLVLDTLRSAERHGAVVVNYMKWVDASREGNTWHCEIHDQITGRPRIAQARAIVNAAGPWSHLLKHSGVGLRLTKGVHLVIERDVLPVTDAVVIAEDGRILFVIPWGGRVILGTTDTDYSGAPENVAVDPSDIAYIIAAVNRAFPLLRLRRDQILSSWAGLRPLLAKPDGSPSDISRRHEITSPEPGWWDVTGGKLTTYRLMAQETVDQIAAHLKTRIGPCCTAEEPLLTASEVIYSRVIPPPVTREAVEHYIRCEWTFTLEDLMVRRSGWHYYCNDLPSVAERVANWCAESAGWEPARTAEQLAGYLRNHLSITR
jgi:glycerol-3-phosphate dehydrogenase